MALSLEEAKQLMTPEAKEKLRNVVNVNKPTINYSNKMNNDIVMQALCRAIDDGIIRPDDMDDTLIKLVNSSTNTVSYPKLIRSLNTIHKTNPNIVCVISLRDTKESTLEPLKEWIIDGKESNITYHRIFEYVLATYKITPHDVRIKMTETLKPTVVNNVAQLIAKYNLSSEEDREKIVISMRTITRLINMVGYMLFCEFRKMK